VRCAILRATTSVEDLRVARSELMIVSASPVFLQNGHAFIMWELMPVPLVCYTMSTSKRVLSGADSSNPTNGCLPPWSLVTLCRPEVLLFPM
jgi:hypothetical protein